MAQEITLARIVQAGVVPMDTAAVASELQKTWHREDAQEWAEVYTKVFPPYRLLIESYMKRSRSRRSTNSSTRSAPHKSSGSGRSEARSPGPVAL
jgi:hypothetical protein